MTVQATCPCCGVYTNVSLTPEESEEYVKENKHIPPEDFLARSVCDYCLEDGYKVSSPRPIQVVKRQYVRILPSKFKAVGY